MSDIQLTMTIPEDLARDAEDFDLLTPDKLLTLIREEVDKRVMDLVNAEIQAYRAEKRGKQNQNDHTS